MRDNNDATASLVDPPERELTKNTRRQLLVSQYSRDVDVSMVNKALFFSLTKNSCVFRYKKKRFSCWKKRIRYKKRKSRQSRRLLLLSVFVGCPRLLSLFLGTTEKDSLFLQRCSSRERHTRRAKEHTHKVIIIIIGE